MSPEGELYPVVGRPFSGLLDAKRLADDLAEPLVESAPLQFKTAKERCPHGTACEAYHAVWQYLRLSGLARSVRADGSLYVAAAEELARAGRLNRVLIVGSADYSMLAHLAYGARRGGANPRFDVVDRCVTPLHLNEWYAARNGLQVHTVQSEMLQFVGDGEFDLICSHSFIHWIPVAHRDRLFMTWQRQLAADGRVCFSTRVWDTHYVFQAPEMEERVSAMSCRAVVNLEQKAVPLPCGLQEFLDLLRRYGYRRDEHVPLPLSDIKRWIAGAALTTEIAVSATKVVSHSQDNLPGPFPFDRGPRLWFQLRKA